MISATLRLATWAFGSHGKYNDVNDYEDDDNDGRNAGYSLYRYISHTWGPHQVFVKTEDYGLFSVKKVKTQFLAKCRNED
mgnify:CR=1 FL=1